MFPEFSSKFGFAQNSRLCSFENMIQIQMHLLLLKNLIEIFLSFQKLTNC